MNRSIIYSQEQARAFDWLWGWKEPLIGQAFLEQDIVGGTTAYIGGLVATPTAPTSLTINLAQGRIYQQAVVDATAYGALPSDAALIMQQGFAAAQTVTLTTASLSAGQSQWALVQAFFSQVDVVRTNDPTGGILNYWNSANPSQPLQGPGNDGQTQPTERKGVCSISVEYGSAATTGSEVPPQPTTGCVPLYLVDLTFGQTTINGGQILTAGPSVGTGVPSNYPGAPFLAGLTNQHHKGIPGQAPQIDLTSEVKNILPLSNLPASNTTGGGIAVFKRNAGNPNGNVAGNANVNGTQDFCYDTTNKLLYACITTGTTSTAVWQLVGQASTSQFAGGSTSGTANAQLIPSTTPSGFSLTAGYVVTVTIGAGLTNTGAATLNVDSTGIIAINKNSGGSNVPLTGGELVAGQFVSFIYTGTVWLLQANTLGALATLNIGQWLKNDGSGNLTISVPASGALLGDDGSGHFTILATAVTAGTYTRPKMTVSATGQVTAASNGLAPTFQNLTSGTGTVTPSANVKRWRVRMAAGGGSGATFAAAGAAGGQTSLGSWTAVGGGAGGQGAQGSTSGGGGGAGGSGGTNGTGTLIRRQAGDAGQTGFSIGSDANFTLIPTTAGATNAFGGGGPGEGGAANGTSSHTSTIRAPGGGGAGEYVEFDVINPIATGYAVGAGGAVGGASGSAGAIYIEEFYD